MKKLLWLVTNRNFILILSIVLGLSIGNVGDWIKHLTIPALVIVMVVSLTQISLKSFLNARLVIKSILYTILFNFVIFGGVMLGLAWFLIKDGDLWIGFVIAATALPGVAIAPFSHIIGGDEKFSVIGVIGAHIAALFLIPLAIFIFIGKSFIQPLNLIILFVELIIAPIIISQILVKFNLDRYLLKWRGTIINWGLFIIIFVVISLNRDVFFRDFKTLGMISLICIITIFGLWLLTNLVLKKLKFSDERRKSLVLAATVKNSGFAAASALALFGEKASLPGAILGIFLVVFLIVISIKPRKKSVK